MTIEFNCGSCSTTLRVPKEHLGKQARCPKCKNLNVVQPGAAPMQMATAPSSHESYSPNPYSAGQSPALPAGGRVSQGFGRPHRGGIILTLGIMAICCNIAAVPGILAWVMGRNDLRLMDAGQMDPDGRGITQAGMIMGMVMTILAIIGFVFVICYFLFIFILFVGMAGAAANGGM